MAKPKRSFLSAFLIGQRISGTDRGGTVGLTGLVFSIHADNLIPWNQSTFCRVFYSPLRPPRGEATQKPSRKQTIKNQIMFI
jgi:hypothetical protein